MTLFNGVTFRHPVLRINNRDHNIDFYQKLGFKLVNEENAIAVFSTKQRNAHFVIEESPAPDICAVEGDKKINRIVVKIPKAAEIEGILGNGIDVERLFKGKRGYAFETVSPEGDLFLLHSEDNIHELREIENKTFPENDDLKEVSEFHFESLTLNVADKAGTQAFYQTVFGGKLPLDLQFEQGNGANLTVDPQKTWDLEILEFKVPKNYNLKALADYLEAKGQSIYLDKKESVLVLSDPSQVEIWFIK